MPVLRVIPGAQEYSQWPTFPQVYIGGEFFGGCDIMIGEDLDLRASRACRSFVCTHSVLTLCRTPRGLPERTTGRGS